jgi:GDP-4-dehydro-6-deoxy-D-mannose reductase
MRALVTGASGFVGAHLIRHLLSSGDEVLATSLLQPGEELGCPFRTLDVADPKQCREIINDFAPQVVYHLAGLAFVPDAEEDFERALIINVSGTHNVMRTCHLLQRGIGVVVISSAEVYGRIKASDLPIVETAEARPINNYSLTKLMAEWVARRYEQYGQVRAVIMRPFNHVGPGQDARFVVSNFAQQLARIARKKTEARIRVGNLDARRDFSDVRDIVRAYRLAAKLMADAPAGPHAGFGTFNLGSGRSRPVSEILTSLIELAAVKVDVEPDPARMRPAEVPEVYGSYERARTELGWVPRISLIESLESVYRYWYERV